jgi:hypothetical protein
MLAFFFFIVVLGWLFLVVSAFIRCIGLLISAKDRQAFWERPVLHLFWFGSAVLSLLVVLFFPVSICRPPPGYAEICKVRADLKNIEYACRAYALEYNHLPTGNHTQVVNTLRGGNARRIVFLETPARRNATSKQGEFLDAWSTPYRFSLIEGQSPIIISAGNTRLFGDQDDLSTTN